MGNYVGSKVWCFFSPAYLWSCILLWEQVSTTFSSCLEPVYVPPPMEESPPKAKLSKVSQIQIISSCNTPSNLPYCNIALATCSLVLWKLEITKFQNFMFCVISLTLEKKLLTGIAPARIPHTHHPSTSLLAQPSWKKKTGCWEHLVCCLLDFTLIVKINSGYQLKKKKKKKAGSAAWLWSWPKKKMVKNPVFNFLHNIVVLPLSSESYLFMLLRAPQSQYR